MQKKALPTLAFTLLPFCAYANAGTPLMWASMLHLVIGNALIGLGEGLLIGWLFKVPKRVCLPVMMGANYLSAWVGGLLLNRVVTPQLDWHLYNAWGWIWAMVALTWVASLFLEWPFVAFCLRKLPHGRWRSIKANLLVQAISYALIFNWYWGASRNSLYAGLEVVPLPQMATAEAARVYFISALDGAVYSMRLNGSDRQKVFGLQSTSHNDRLAVKKTTGDHWNLVARLVDGSRDGNVVVLVTNLASNAVEDWRTAERNEIGDTGMNFGTVPSLGGTNDWEFSTGFWAAEGLGASRTNGQQMFWFALETPFVAWRVRNATALPHNQVVFQLGKDQICLLDFPRKQIALLARGRGPVVACQRRSENGVIMAV